MLKVLEKYWPIISISFILAILASLFFWPVLTRPLALIVMLAGLGMMVTISVQRHLQALRQGRLDRPGLRRKIGVDVLGILITMVVVILVAGKVGGTLGQAAWRAAEGVRPGMGMPAGILAGLLAGALVGLGVSLLVRWAWGRLVKSFH